MERCASRVSVYGYCMLNTGWQTLINKPFRERRELLKTRFPPREPDDPTIARWDHVKCMEGFPNNLEPIRQFMLEAISQKCEGLMLKLLDSVVPPAETDEVKAEGDDNELDGQDEVEPEGGDDTVEEMENEDEKPDVTEAKKGGRRKALLATYEPDKRVESWVSFFPLPVGVDTQADFVMFFSSRSSETMAI